MKEIGAAQREAILDAIGEGLSPLPAGVLEKDLLVTAVLRALADFPDPAQLFFCGGTCLSKAHRLVRRMSEDVDFKMRIPATSSRSAARRALSELKHVAARHLRAAGFEIPDDDVQSRADNTKISLRAVYASRFPAVASLRPEIRVQLVAMEPRLPVRSLPLRSLLAEIVELDEEPVTMPCVAVDETLAEKVVAMLRRLAISDSADERSAPGELIRHVYDVAMICRGRPSAPGQETCEVFRAAAVADAEEFSGRDPLFAQDPFLAMRGALALLLDDRGGQLRAAYGRFATDLVYGEVPSFEEARLLFVSAAEKMINKRR